MIEIYGLDLRLINRRLLETLVCFSLFLLISIEANTQCANTDVSTAAGTGVSGHLDGPVSSALLNIPRGIAVDNVGNLYIAEWAGHRIRKVTPDGNVSTLAGTGVFGDVDGPGNIAQFGGPVDLTVDDQGNLIVVDQSNDKIRKVTPEGVVSTIAGSGITGYRDGPALSAQLDGPRGIVINADGDILIAESGNDVIRKLSISTNMVSTFSGNGTAGYLDGNSSSAMFNNPRGMDMDANGNIIVADASNSRIRKISPSGMVSTVAGNGNFSFADGPALSAEFFVPSGIAVDQSGNILVADLGNNRIRKISTSGMVSTLAGDGTNGFMDGPANTAQFRGPFRMAIDAGGNAYTTDGDSHSIRKIGNCPLPTIANVPTISEWGLIILSIMLVILGVVGISQKIKIRNGLL